ncbi:MAG TPA: cold-shock protein [Gammaproteobacteria bacterium]|nr:cold-shock protein [Gammaproteobacteria bacterium]
MPTGTVKWFNNRKGYGFVVPDEQVEEDVFIHYSSIEMEGFKTLREGQKVNFELSDGPKGLHATNITDLI